MQFARLPGLDLTKHPQPRAQTETYRVELILSLIVTMVINTIDSSMESCGFFSQA